MNFNERCQHFKNLVESAFDEFLPPTDSRPARLHQAMHYSMRAGGKRLRPILLLGTFHTLSPINTERNPLPAAVAMECLHTYSLIHDDLPSIDNSDLRRGNPTCHCQFDEPTALLAGDALLTLAFQILADSYALEPKLANQLVRELSKAAGSLHLIGGQMEDILGENSDYTLEQLEFIHLNKTAALIRASFVMGAILADANHEQLEAVAAIGTHVGLAFQIIDDILDATSDANTLGKTTGADEALQKTTYVTLLGLDEARSRAQQETSQALDKLASLPQDSNFLSDLVHQMGQRLS